MKQNFDERGIPSKNKDRGTETVALINLSLEDLLTDDCEQIVHSNELIHAFVKSSKDKKYYGAKIYSLFKYVVCLYNDTMNDADKFGALTYLTRISNLLDYMQPTDIMELSIDQLNSILDIEDGNEILQAYESIKNSRHLLTEAEFKIYVEMLKNNSSRKIKVKIARKTYDYIANIYNTNTILQDNVSYLEYLDAFSKQSEKSIISLRMCQILDMFGMKNINYDNINEEKMLINDLTKLGLNIL